MDMFQVNSLRQALIQERNDINQRLYETDEYGMRHPMNDHLSELSGYDNHPGDLGTEMFEREKDIALRDLDRMRLDQINDALARMNQGSFGSCERCGQAIDMERLAVEPEARYCIGCQKIVEAQDDPNRERPIDESLTTPPFARIFMDDTDRTAFDGEDSWQAVARYNQRPRDHHDYEEVYDDDNEGIVDPIDRITNEEYFEQLPD